MWSRQDLLSARAWNVLIVRYRDGGSQGAARSIARGWWHSLRDGQRRVGGPGVQATDVVKHHGRRNCTSGSAMSVGSGAGRGELPACGEVRLSVTHTTRASQRSPEGPGQSPWSRPVVWLVHARWPSPPAGAQRGHKQESIMRQGFSASRASRQIGRFGLNPVSSWTRTGTGPAQELGRDFVDIRPQERRTGGPTLLKNPPGPATTLAGCPRTSRGAYTKPMRVAETEARLSHDVAGCSTVRGRTVKGRV